MFPDVIEAANFPIDEDYNPLRKYLEKTEGTQIRFREKDRDNFFALNKLDPFMAGHKGFICGGCFKNRFNGEKIKDVDIFFENEADYDKLALGARITLEHAREQVAAAAEGTLLCAVTEGGERIALRLDISQRQAEMLLAGGLLNATKEGGNHHA